MTMKKDEINRVYNERNRYVYLMNDKQNKEKRRKKKIEEVERSLLAKQTTPM